MSVNINFKLLSHGVEIPKFATTESAGMDLYAASSEDVVISPAKWKLIPTGIAMQMPQGYEAQLRPRSGLSLKHGISVLNSPATIDSDYRGEIKVVMVNFGENDFVIERGMRIAQMVICKLPHVNIVVVNDLEENQSRGELGFGSTGYK